MGISFSLIFWQLGHILDLRSGELRITRFVEGWLHSAAFFCRFCRFCRYSKNKKMHILYVDNSGDVENPTEQNFVLGGVAIFERGIYHQITAVDNCVARFGLGDPADIELHGSPMYSASCGIWRTVRQRSLREQMIKDALAVFSSAASVQLFAVVVNKAAVGH